MERLACEDVVDEWTASAKGRREEHSRETRRDVVAKYMGVRRDRSRQGDLVCVGRDYWMRGMLSSKDGRTVVEASAKKLRSVVLLWWAVLVVERKTGGIS